MSETRRGAPPEAGDRRESVARHGAALLFLALLVAVAFRDVIGADRGLYFRDHLLVFKPRWWAAIESLRAFELPSFTHASASGVPLEALLNGTFTPATLIFFTADFELAYDLFVIAHYLILAAGAYGLAISLGATRSEAFAAAAIAALAGPILSLENLLVMAQGLAFAPWVYWALHRLLLDPRPSRAAPLAIALGFHLQAVLPEILLLDLLAAVALFIHARPPLARPIFAASILAAAGGLAIAAVEVIPVLAHLPHTRRGQGFSYEETAHWALQLPQLIEFFVPAFWSPPEAPFIKLSEVTGSPHRAALLTSHYLGAAIALGACAAASRTHRRPALLLIAVAAAGLLIALGTPLHRLIVSLPLLSSSRYPVKYLVLVVAALAALAPLGLRDLRERPRIISLLFGAQLATAIGILIVVHTAELTDYLAAALDREPSGFIGLSIESHPEIAQTLMQPRALHAVIFAALAAIAALAKPQILPIIIAADLALAGHFAVIGAPVEPQEPPKKYVELLASKTHRLYPVAPAPGAELYRHQPGHTHLEDRIISFRRRGYHLYKHVRSYEQVDLDAAGNRNATLAFSAMQQLPPADARRALARAGVHYTSIPRREEVPGAIEMEVPGEPPQYLIPIEGVRPYARAYTRWIDASDFASSEARYRSLVLSEAHWDAALIEGDPGGSATATATVTVSSSTESKIELEVESSSESIVVVLEYFVHGWRAFVGDRENVLLEAELGHLAQRVPAGRHRVRFEYDPVAPPYAYLSAIALLLALVVCAVTSPRRRSDL